MHLSHRLRARTKYEFMVMLATSTPHEQHIAQAKRFTTALRHQITQTRLIASMNLHLEAETQCMKPNRSEQ